MQICTQIYIYIYIWWHSPDIVSVDVNFITWFLPRDSELLYEFFFSFVVDFFKFKFVFFYGYSTTTFCTLVFASINFRSKSGELFNWNISMAVFTRVQHVITYCQSVASWRLYWQCPMHLALLRAAAPFSNRLCPTIISRIFSGTK